MVAKLELFKSSLRHLVWLLDRNTVVSWCTHAHIILDGVLKSGSSRHRGVVLITFALYNLSKLGLMFCVGSSPVGSVSEIWDGENLGQMSRLKIRINAIRWSIINHPAKAMHYYHHHHYHYQPPSSSASASITSRHLRYMLCYVFFLLIWLTLSSTKLAV